MASSEKLLTVTQLTQLIKDNLESSYSDVVLVGEISNFKAHSSGHFYFSLKDEGAQISAVMFKGSNQRLKFVPENGMKVFGIGKISVYPPRGNYQIVLSRLEPEGRGALQLAFEQLREKLKLEGLFSADRKRPIPRFPEKIGIVTSPTGAAIQDMLSVLGRRFSGVELKILPVRVQGEGAAVEVARGIEWFNQFFSEMDVLIVGRGGGSLEDLWAFNEEIVARAIVNSKIPIISAVGHEVDFSIADMVADLRAPTPSAAAELVVSDRLETLRRLDSLSRRLRRSLDKLETLQMRVDELIQRLYRGLQRGLMERQAVFQRLQIRLSDRSPLLRLREVSHRYRDLSQRKLQALRRRIEAYQRRLESLDIKRQLLDPRSIMARGYSLVRIQKTGKIIRKVSEVQMGERLVIELAKGKITARVSS
ncbi:MAG: exodeoxyribonuclease VII large subunit [Bradymonadales bacterium]|nr:MAG: exodeoxyribonuclease VII large subunit [Bradymonadales bacterium]